MKKPEPKPLQIVCSSCGMDWEKHGEKPSLEKCVELLKAELAKRPSYNFARTSATNPYWFIDPNSAIA